MFIASKKFNNWLKWAKIYITALDNLSPAEGKMMLSSHGLRDNATREEKSAYRSIHKRFRLREKAGKIITKLPDDIPVELGYRIHKFIFLVQLSGLCSGIMLTYPEKSDFCGQIMKDLEIATKDICGIISMYS